MQHNIKTIALTHPSNLHNDSPFVAWQLIFNNLQVAKKAA